VNDNTPENIIVLPGPGPELDLDWVVDQVFNVYIFSCVDVELHLSLVLCLNLRVFGVHELFYARIDKSLYKCTNILIMSYQYCFVNSVTSSFCLICKCVDYAMMDYTLLCT